jgi:thioredoxin-like negative regulator of GroEL
VVERLLVVGAVAALAAVLALAGRALAVRRLRGLRRAEPADLWAALGTEPDGRPAVVAFSSPSCAACRTAQDPALAELQARLEGGVRVIHVDAAERPEVARRFGVLTVPSTVVLDRRGAVTDANQGFASADRLAAQLEVDTLALR